MEDFLGFIIFIGFIIFSVIKNIAENSDSSSSSHPSLGGAQGGGSGKVSILETLQAHLEETLNEGNSVLGQAKPPVIREESHKVQASPLPTKETSSFAVEPEEEDMYSEEPKRIRGAMQEAIIWKEILDQPVSLR